MTEERDILQKTYESDGFLSLKLNRPDRLNALNPDLLYALKEAVEEANSNTGLKGVILSGAGGNFCAGGDIYTMKRAVDINHIGALSPFISILEEAAFTFYSCHLPTVCILDGIVAGAGIGIALAADVRIATDATRCHFAFPTLGAIPDAGSSYLLPHIIGYHRAMEFYISNEPIDAHKGLSWGMFHEVVPKDKVHECLRVWKEKIERLSKKGFRLSKDLFQQALYKPIEEQVRAEYFAQLAAMNTDHFSRKIAELTTKKDKK